MTPCLLALDTSTDQMAVALLTPVGEYLANERGGPLASARLIPLLLQLLADAGVALPEVQAIAFGQGPGAFTGLRTACAVAQGLAFAGNTPVLAIDSLLLIAEDARTQATDCAASAKPRPGLNTPSPREDWWVAVDARMDEVYAARYVHDGAGWRTSVAPQLWTLPALSRAWVTEPPLRVAGSAVSVFGDRLPWGDIERWPETHNRAGALLRLARAAWDQGRGIAADQALPLYLRDKVALTSAERLVQRQTVATAARLA
jgi:tRNA threonylcarbamoyladenosine biosynthesis protein TsaB